MASSSPEPLDSAGFTGPLADCGDSPNCVCTQATRAAQAMPAIPFTGSAAEAIEQVARCLPHWPRTRVVSRKSNYLHLTFRTPLFRFVDDVEFFADEQAHLLHYRSASRLGYFDFGVNRRRMARLARHIARRLREHTPNEL